jgi:galactosylceramidase
VAGQSTDVSPDSCHVPPLRKLDVEMRVQGHDSPAASSMTTTLDLATSLDKRTALRHDGIGIIADATTKLLYSYDEPFRGEIIDYFFKPQFGASLDILKVEVGGDGQNTLGTSSSHQHTKEEAPDFSRGMLWWLMAQVQVRRGDVQFYGLPWCYPGWVKSPYSPEAAEYLAAWLDGARGKNLSVSFIGISQNERPPCDNAKPISKHSDTLRCDGITLKRAAFNAHGHTHVKIVAPDAFDFDRTKGDVIMMKNSSDVVWSDVDIVGVHGAAPLSDLYGPLQSWLTEESTNSSKPLWNSENEAGYMGVRFLARALVRAYVENNASGFIEWPLTNGAYNHLPFMNNILPSESTQPWSGSYNISTHIWAFAHHTQFANPGWLFDRANSRILPKGGSIVTRHSPNGADFASVIETVPCEDMPVGPHDGIRYKHNFRCPNATDPPQRLSFRLPPNVKKVAVWQSEALSDADHSGWFNRQPDLRTVDGVVDIEVGPQKVITITSLMNRGHKGSHPKPPSPAPFPLPFAVNFSLPDAKYTSVPKYFLDQRGVFEITQVGPPYGRVLRQAVPESEVVWIPGPSFPVSIIGEWTWTNYKVKASVLIPTADGHWVSVGGLVNSSGIGVGGNQPDSGVFLKASVNKWSLEYATGEVLSNGTLPAATNATTAASAETKSQAWHELSVEFRARTGIVVVIDGHTVASHVVGVVYKNGWAAIGCGWNECLYRSFEISKVPE